MGLQTKVTEYQSTTERERVKVKEEGEQPDRQECNQNSEQKVADTVRQRFSFAPITGIIYVIYSFPLPQSQEEAELKEGEKTKELLRVLRYELHSWSFDVFKFNSLTNGWPLTTSESYIVMARFVFMNTEELRSGGSKSNGNLTATDLTVGPQTSFSLIIYIGYKRFWQQRMKVIGP